VALEQIILFLEMLKIIFLKEKLLLRRKMKIIQKHSIIVYFQNGVHVEPSHWPYENHGPKIVCHHFQPLLISLPDKVGTYFNSRFECKNNLIF
jgi:hypothetical protein